MCTHLALFITLPPAQRREWRAWPVEPTRRLQTSTAVHPVLWYIWALHPAGQARRWARRAKHATTTFRDPAAKLVPSSSSHVVLLAILLVQRAPQTASVSPPLHAGFHEVFRFAQAPNPPSMDAVSARMWVQAVLLHVGHDVQTEMSTLLRVKHPVVGVVHSEQPTPQPWVWRWYTRNVHHFCLLALVWRIVHRYRSPLYGGSWRRTFSPSPCHRQAEGRKKCC